MVAHRPMLQLLANLGKSGTAEWFYRIKNAPEAHTFWRSSFPIENRVERTLRQTGVQEI